MNEVAWLYTQINAGREVWAPEWRFAEADDLNAKADLDKKLYSMGVRFTRRHFSEQYGLQGSEFDLEQDEAPQILPEKDKKEDPEEQEDRQEYAALPDLPAQQAQDILDQAILKILPKALSANEQFLTRLESAVQNAQSFDAMFLALADLLAEQTEPDELEEIMAQAMTAATGFGAAAVNEELS